MKQISKLFKLLTLVMAMVALGTTNAYAGSSKTYYAKATATATGNGKVYVGTSKSAPDDDKYQKTSEASSSASSTGDNANVDFYLFAEPSDATTKFDGWFDNEECTGTALSTANPYNAKMTSNSTNQSSPVTKSYFAKFVEATEFYSSTFTVTCVGEGGSVAVSTESGNEDFGAEKSASNLNDVEATHTYYLQAKLINADVYRFVGWYSDEACENQLSTNANYTYKVTAESTDEAAPTQFHAYAKFEAIPYYFSTMSATAIGNGKVNVSATSKAGEYETVSEAPQKVADKTTHTYYLKATPDADVLFDGWYADEECTNLLSNAASYTYDVAECSADEAAPTTVSVYAKFVAVDLYQFANAGFEKWETITYSNKSCEEPLNWSSFLDATGGMKSMGANKQIEKSTDVREGATGYSAKVYANAVVGVVAQGNLTNGCINMGSMTATDASGNYNYINEARADQAMRFEGRPDAVKVWAKYKGYDATYNKGNISIILTTKGFYQDPLANASKITATKVAHASFPEVESNDEWTLYTIPFEYYTDDVPYYSLATLSTNATPGKGNKSDYLFVDDIEMVYNSAELKDAKYNDTEIVFENGAATVNAAYNVALLSLESNAAGAIIEKTFDAESGLLTVVVKGGDYGINPSNKFEYTIQFVPTKAVMAIANGAEWGTFCAAVDVEIPADVKAYTVDGVNDTELVLTPVTETIPANTVVVLNGAPFSKDIFCTAATGTVETGLLVGTMEAVAAPVGSYVLQNHNGVVGFYQVEDVQPTVKANRAYLNVPAATEAKVFTFGNATAIDKITAENANKAIYDLSGRQLQKLQKGINIVNGVKVLVK